MYNEQPEVKKENMRKHDIYNNVDKVSENLWIRLYIACTPGKPIYLKLHNKWS